MTNELFVLLGLVAATAGVAWWWRARDGVVRAVDGPVEAGLRDELGVPPHAQLLLEFTAPGCVPCRTVRRMLDEIAAERGDVVVAELDVSAGLQLARKHNILRAPTVLLVGRDGAVHARVAGVPDADALRAALDASPAAA